MLTEEREAGVELRGVGAPGAGPGRGPTWVWGVPFSPMTAAGAVEAVDRLIARGRPSYFITANLNYAMLSRGSAELRAINRRAAMVLADGMPPVWASRRSARPLPERVAGSDLIFALADRASRRGHRVFLLGGAPGVADRAARNLEARSPGLRIVGAESPRIDPLDAGADAPVLRRIRDARPDLLLVALGQPKGELWLARNVEALGVPACVQVGAALDFAAGRVRRAPTWARRAGLEWAFRLALEPSRLARRYARNAAFLLRMIALDVLGPAPAGPEIGGPHA